MKTVSPEVKAFFANKSIADALHHAAFDNGRDPRSEAYHAGLEAALYVRFGIVPLARNQNPYPAASEAADAWFAGFDEGSLIYRHYEAEKRLEALQIDQQYDESIGDLAIAIAREAVTNLSNVLQIKRFHLYRMKVS